MPARRTENYFDNEAFGANFYCYVEPFGCPQYCHRKPFGAKLYAQREIPRPRVEEIKAN